MQPQISPILVITASVYIKKIDSFSTNSDYSAMAINHNTLFFSVEMRRIVALPVWRARQWPVVDSKI
jgi:hypothetical protein